MPTRPRAKATPNGVWRRGHASSYGMGDGLLGARLACGGHLTAEILAVANRTLPCGTRVQIRVGTRLVLARVLDRGPYVRGIDFNLSPAVCAAIRDCSGDVAILWRVP